MATHLEDDIEALSDLDDLRVSSAVLRDQGRLALCDLPGERWESARDDVQDALVVKALSGWKALQDQAKPQELFQGLLDLLKQRSLPQVFDEEPDKVPVLRAARILQALVAAPYCAFSKTALFCYYRVVRELYTADAPDWTIGGARAGAGGVASAFITAECIRAIRGFARTLERTGRFVGSLRENAERLERVSSGRVPQAWREAEDRRLSLDFYTQIQRLAGDIALPLAVGELHDSSPEAVQQYCREIRAGLLAALDRSVLFFGEVKAAVADFREVEEKVLRSLPRGSPERREKVTRFERAASGHLVALSAIEQAIDKARKAFEVLRRGGLGAIPLATLERLFEAAAGDVRKLLHPPRHFIATVLDRELAAASAENIAWDPSEMAFAAASFGAVESWEDERLGRAGYYLAKAISERGRFPVGRPIHSMSRGYKLNVLGGEVLRAFAQLLQHVPAVEIKPQLVRRMLLFFEDRRVIEPKRMSAWYHEAPQQPVRPDRSVTAVAVLALSRINRMLDERINSGAFRHFSVRQPQSLRKGPNLQSLFYGDYGLCRAPEGVRRQESVAIALQRMQAHVAGVRLPPDSWSPLYSVVLHGPPGTGKTTLVEALAASCEVPLVEVTPSDIVVGGADAIERRTRAVFKALSLLTRAVISFDEFDPVLMRRDAKGRTPPSVFSFLTPGMLPKLKTLNKSAEGRGVAYVLITNLIGTLDEAAIRSGRFDERIGIYPPDLLSRAGRLTSEFLEFCRESNRGKVPRGLEERIRTVVRATAGAPMQVLGRPGWLTRPRSLDDLPKDTLFHYLLRGSSQPARIEPEARREPNPRGKGPVVELEHRQWAWIEGWDAKLDGRRDLAAALSDLPPAPAAARDRR